MSGDSNPLLCIKACIVKLKCLDEISGIGVSPSRYSMTCCMLGLALVNGCEHRRPSFRTRQTSSILKSAWSLLSMASISLCPQVTSRRNMPNAKTSIEVDALPVRTNSGAKYPMVPTM
uniref:Uncharacterized protein n=1 Tax=Oryza glumipatula TaxID=40148 RepID=A0A0E0AI52_9ORYZ